MYRILIQTKIASLNSPATYQWLIDNSAIWETNSKDEALARYEAELNNYKRSVITLIKVVEVDLNPSVEGCVCDPDCSCSTTSAPTE